MTKNHYPDVDIMKGIAIFLVYFGHSILVYPVDLHSIPLWDRMFRIVESVHMPMFFLLSGFCFSYASPYKKYLNKKFLRVMVPYLFFAPFNLAVKLLLPDLVNGSENLIDGIADIIFYGDGYWFLYCAFLVFMLFPVFDALFGKLPWTFAIILPILCAMSLDTGITSFMTLRLCFHYLPYFVIGYLIRRFCVKCQDLFSVFTGGNKNHGTETSETPDVTHTYSHGKQTVAVRTDKPERSPKWLIPGGILGVLWIYIMERLGGSVYSPGYILCALTGMAAIFSMVKAGVFDIFYSLLKLMGKYSLPLYVINGYLLVVSRALICGVLGIREPILIVLLNLTADMAVAMFIVHFIVMKAGLFRFIFGMGGVGNG